MRALKAAMQAIVAHAVAEAIAGLLVEDGRNLRCQLVGVSLVRILSIRSPKLILSKDGQGVWSLLAEDRRCKRECLFLLLPEERPKEKSSSR